MTKSKRALMREYNRELNKVLNRIMKLRSEGYIIHERNVPKPKPEKKITPSELQRLKKYKESYIKNLRGTKYKTRTGKIVSGAKGEEIQRSEASKKGWRERKEREKRERFIRLGDALINSIRHEIAEGRAQIPMIKSQERAQGYHDRCNLLDGTLDIELSDRPGQLMERLGKVNESVAVERTQIACRYDRGATEGEAWSAALQMLGILRGQSLTMAELKDTAGEVDVYEYFEDY